MPTCRVGQGTRAAATFYPALLRPVQLEVVAMPPLRIARRLGIRGTAGLPSRRRGVDGGEDSSASNTLTGSRPGDSEVPRFDRKVMV